YVVDDDPATRDAMSVLFDSVSIDNQIFESAKTLLEKIVDERPGCILIDLRMPEMSGLELQTALQERNCHLPVIFLTGYGNVGSAVNAMRDGAMDFLTKPADDEALLAKVKKAIANDRDRRKSRREHHTLAARLSNLTQREREVLEAVVQGMSNKEIARELAISPKTVELHRAHMMQKMHAQSVADAVRMYMTASHNSRTIL